MWVSPARALLWNLVWIANDTSKWDVFMCLCLITLISISGPKVRALLWNLVWIANDTSKWNVFMCLCLITLISFSGPQVNQMGGPVL